MATAPKATAPKAEGALFIYQLCIMWGELWLLQIKIIIIRSSGQEQLNSCINMNSRQEWQGKEESVRKLKA